MPKLETIITEEQIAKKVAELAERIRQDYQNAPIHLIAVLKGSAYFLADLSRKLGDDVTIDFVKVSSYGDAKTSSGTVQIVKDLDDSIEGKNVLIVEDIIDTGTTLNHLRELFQLRKPKSLRVVALLSKAQARRINTTVEYIGFEIPDHFVVGYGLDHAERYRNLPFIANLRD
ncbi:MAG: hypoxanthine phosphoribosyltransferase [Fimbriimonadaceae bacterium]|nr:hypoxanthine phosphoribosyltransferase [Fimbriimonadaceae bacterium]